MNTNNENTTTDTKTSTNTHKITNANGVVAFCAREALWQRLELNIFLSYSLK